MRLGVIPILNAYINHQKDVVTNRTNFLLEKAKTRLHIVEGFMKMIDVVDEVIKTIRASKNKADSKNNIILKFGFSELQAEAIVTMQLYRLSNQDIEALKAEEKELNKNILKYEKILNSEKELLKVIKGELDEINKTIIQPRKSQIEEHVSSLKVDETELIAKEQVIVSVSKEGYLKRISLKSFNAGKNIGLKDNDATLFTKEVSTLDKLLIFTNLGNFIYLPVYKITECKLKDIGTFINSLVQIQPKERFIKVYSISEFNSNTNVLLVTNEGSIKQCSLNEFEVNRYTKPVRAMKLGSGEELVDVDMSTNPLEIMVFTHNAEALRFRASEVSLYGTNAGGVKSIITKPKDYVVSAIYCNKNDDFLLLTSRNTIKRMKVTDVVLTKRARTGSSVIKLLKSNPYLLIQASKLTPNQYKENVSINLIYKNGNDSLEAFSLKYNVSDSGKTIVSDNSELKELFGMTIPEPIEPDKEISGDYLIEIKDIAVSVDDGAVEEKPIVSSKTTKKEKKANASILDELNDILFKETGVKKKNVLHPDVDDDSDDSKSIKYKKISLFDEF
jgi:topoisomerase-4 subunit A